MSSEPVLVESLASSAKNSIVGGPFGSNLVSKDYVPSGVPVIRGQNMGEKWVGGDFVFVSEDKATLLEPNKARPGDLVFTQRGTLGQVAIVPHAPYPEYIVSQSQMKLTPDPAKADVSYLYYAFLSPEQQEYIRNTAIQTGVPHTNLGILKRTPITLPSVEIQREIAGVLGSLDDRIALLRETNATLEAIAQALFKSWFVDFDPVRAKLEGRAPEGMDEATAALFPDGFEESELGLVPRGWKVGSILDVAQLLSGGTPKTDCADYWGGKIGWASAKDVSQSEGSVLIQTERTITRRGLDESSTRLIPPFATVIVARGATTGRMVIFGRELAMNQTCYALNSKIGTPLALYCQLRRAVGVLVNAAHGSVFDTITTKTFAQSRTILPDAQLLRAFEELVRPLFEKVVEGTTTLNTLTLLRDTLLPRLISGQLRLPEAEAHVAEAMA
ncbi:restriction endonuclease subunit S [Nitrogeniibacter aestuarii]|uniref:restriction endonuclease subunit S n=1 Tax=Nitrogeniibacter aestuarii TaxID=2815343 RepID=UPI001D1234A8|nr:restriction endonuclease subunit S [Nitrogeniibacter aestuarii]